MTPIPVDRLVANLEARLLREPANVRVIVNLARLHAYTFALGVTWVPQLDNTGLPSIPAHDSDLPSTNIVSPVTPERRAHLEKAIVRYREALRLQRDELVARLGLAWCLEQAARSSDAIAEYRILIDLAWPRERESTQTTTRFKPLVTEEAGRRLIALLGATDPEESRRLQVLVDEAAVHGGVRAITPLVVPIDKEWSPHEPGVSVIFDADGSGLQRRWSWIGPGAAWLVYDSNHGRIDSALQWFGNVTFWMFWENGYDALCALDDSGDGMLSGRELAHLALWRDVDVNGRSDAEEVMSLEHFGITALSCGRPVVNDEDASVAAYILDGVRFSDGTWRPTYDLILHVVQEDRISRLHE